MIANQTPDAHPETRLFGTLIAVAATLLLAYSILAPVPSYEHAATATDDASHRLVDGPRAGTGLPQWDAMPDGAVTPAETVAAYER